MGADMRRMATRRGGRWTIGAAALLALASGVATGIGTAGAAAFGAGNLLVCRIGTGTGALTSAATAVFVDEYSPGGVLVQSIALPTTLSGANKRLVASGTATSECGLSRSGDGQYALITGYDSAPGTASIASSLSATVNRVVGRVDSAGAIDTTTALSGFSSGNNIRSATSTNGTAIWVAGAAGSPAYTTLGSSTATQISTTNASLRQVHVFGTQLFASSGSGTTTRLGSVGSGTPTTSPQTITSLTGFPTSGSPYSYFFADLDGVPGDDTLYVADDVGSIQKWSLVAGSWSAKGTITAAGVRGLTGSVSGSNVTLFVTYGGLSLQNTLATLTDTTGYNATIAGSLSTLATASPNTVFRGVVFTPAVAPGTEVPEAPVNVLLALSAIAVLGGGAVVMNRRRTA